MIFTAAIGLRPAHSCIYIQHNLSARALPRLKLVCEDLRLFFRCCKPVAGLVNTPTMPMQNLSPRFAADLWAPFSCSQCVAFHSFLRCAQVRQHPELAALSSCK